jgi:hypothetical protein
MGGEEEKGTAVNFSISTCHGERRRCKGARVYLCEVLYCRLVIAADGTSAGVQISVHVLGVGTPQLRGGLVPLDCGDVVLQGPFAVGVRRAQAEHCVGVILLGGLREKVHRHGKVLGDAHAERVRYPEVELGMGVALHRRTIQPGRALGVVERDAGAGAVGQPTLELSRGNTLLGRKVEPPCGFCRVVRRSASWVERAAVRVAQVELRKRRSCGGRFPIPVKRKEVGAL